MNNLRRKGILITGANGNLGKKLIRALEGHSIVAMVRSESAQQQLKAYLAKRPSGQVAVVKCDYFDPAAIASAAAECTYAVHLVGIIKESVHNNFEHVHVTATAALLAALKQTSVSRLFYPSLMGAEPNSSNPCLATRGVAEQLFMQSDLSSLVVQLPMVLGEDDFASRALLRNAMSRYNVMFRAASLEQPVYAGDLIAAIILDYERFLSATDLPDQKLALVGPESLSRAALTQRAAAVLGTNTTTVSLPLTLGLGLAWIMETLSPAPPITRAMLRVLDHDDNVDPVPAAQALGIELTPLDRMLEKTLVRPRAEDN